MVRLSVRSWKFACLSIRVFTGPTSRVLTKGTLLVILQRFTTPMFATHTWSRCASIWIDLLRCELVRSLIHSGFGHVRFSLVSLSSTFFLLSYSRLRLIGVCRAWTPSLLYPITVSLLAIISYLSACRFHTSGISPDYLSFTCPNIDHLPVQIHHLRPTKSVRNRTILIKL